MLFRSGAASVLGVACNAAAYVRARINAPRNSLGNSAGNGLSAGAAVAVGASSDFLSAADFADFLGNLGNHAGHETVMGGLPVRTTSVVVAAYSGNADSINIPNTNPGKPRNCA